MNYIELSIKIANSTIIKEVLIFKLAETGFESFQELDNELKAFIGQDSYDDNCINLIKEVCGSSLFKLDVVLHESTNWNKEWESNFQPIKVNNKCVIRSSFHETEFFEYDVVINPAMTFGTGHHETTLLMAQALFNEKVACSDVLDMGTGTGVLAIICSKLKAKNIDAIDLDPIAVQNTKDNLVLNNINTINVKEGNSALINVDEYDFVLANINKNILLSDLLIYFKSLRNGGKLLMSGFFNLDNKDILDEAVKIGLKFVESKELNKWSLLILSK